MHIRILKLRFITESRHCRMSVDLCVVYQKVLNVYCRHMSDYSTYMSLYMHVGFLDAYE